MHVWTFLSCFLISRLSGNSWPVFLHTFPQTSSSFINPTVLYRHSSTSDSSSRSSLLWLRFPAGLPHLHVFLYPPQLLGKSTVSAKPASPGGTCAVFKCLCFLPSSTRSPRLWSSRAPAPCSLCSVQNPVPMPYLGCLTLLACPVYVEFWHFFWHVLIHFSGYNRSPCRKAENRSSTFSVYCIGFQGGVELNLTNAH